MTPPQLLSRINKALEMGREVKLSKGAIDLLIASGGYDRLVEYSAEWQKAQWQRQRQNPSINGAGTVSLPVPSETMKSFGTTLPEVETEQLARARALAMPQYRPTLEPFLGFVLTRAMPYAVQQRIAKGLFGSWNDGGSGGRTR